MTTKHGTTYSSLGGSMRLNATADPYNNLNYYIKMEPSCHRFSYDKAKYYINHKPGPLVQSELDLLENVLRNQMTENLTARRTSLRNKERGTKTDQAEYLLINCILFQRRKPK